ncbi:glycosyltransferase family 4 protein [Aquimarina muelleri]|uniref:Glycosyltransferase subfamily 4-like N-terminal domain-containing protein n=1 Tax=Aquimarina muelleri TaxID=279356 RepID=A0A918JUF1_9FLAO|nr:glycosyltransferase family 4 protein [Aquimarina muelleri]MCX2762062.1 glycosyltransferase family 4 protein [Aquimarina muelleri]GGX04157.1 hypothetical protein GCM10007384_02440 [Aquimarina muelleri]
MRILFVSSGNTKNGISPIIKNQGQSLISLGYSVTFFTIKGKGFKGYFKNIFELKRFLKKQKFDIIHAHYSLSGMVASLSGASPIVISLMGSDVKASLFLRYIIRGFSMLFWKQIIVKSQDMKEDSGLNKAYVIPNGVDFNKFKPIERSDAINETGWDPNKKHILFAANPNRPEKNFKLAEEAFNLIKEKDIQLQKLVDIPNEKMPYYFNASDVILLTSLWEGSPNVIKEAIACNCKIVAVDVGDIKELVSNIQGCYVTHFDPNEIANKLLLSLNLEQKTTGRDTIRHLDSVSIANKLTKIYKSTTL